MQTLRAVRTAAVRLGLSLLGVGLVFGSPAKAAWDKPWQSQDRALVIDAYEFNPIDWKELTTDKRIVGFINKASDGLAPEWNCRGKSGDEELLCKNRWWKYSVTKELYMTRRAMAKELGLKWGAYHLARPGNPREQADHFVDFAEPAPDELIAIDIEDNTSEWMSLADAEIFANQIFIRTGRYPVLYTNGSTAKWISDYKEKYRLLSRLPLWYARYRDDITGKFPEATWPSYSLWQFSSMHNCSRKKCPYRIKGAKNDIDVNVSPLDVAGLKAAWPFNGLVRPLDEEGQGLVAGIGEKAGSLFSALAGKVAEIAEPGMRHVGKVIAGEVPLPRPVQPASALPERPALAASALVSAYGPVEAARKPALDPLKLLTEAALQEKTSLHGRPRLSTASAAEPGAFGGLESEMKKVAAIVPAPAKPVDVVPVAKTAAFGPTEKSRFRAWLEASRAKDEESVLAMPAFVLSQKPMQGGGRGARPSAGRLSGETAKPQSVDGRIDNAFIATR